MLRSVVRNLLRSFSSGVEGHPLYLSVMAITWMIQRLSSRESYNSNTVGWSLQWASETTYCHFYCYNILNRAYGFRLWNFALNISALSS